jgi:hypothetical protein
MEKLNPHTMGEHKWYNNHSEKQFAVSQNVTVHMKLLYDPLILLLGLYLRELKRVHTKTCTQMFIETLFITAKNRKQRQPKCPSIHGWIKKIW